MLLSAIRIEDRVEQRKQFISDLEWLLKNIETGISNIRYIPRSGPGAYDEKIELNYAFGGQISILIDGAGYTDIMRAVLREIG